MPTRGRLYRHGRAKPDILFEHKGGGEFAFGCARTDLGASSTEGPVRFFKDGQHEMTRMRRWSAELQSDGIPPRRKCARQGEYSFIARKWDFFNAFFFWLARLQVHHTIWDHRADCIEVDRGAYHDAMATLMNSVRTARGMPSSQAFRKRLPLRYDVRRKGSGKDSTSCLGYQNSRSCIAQHFLRVVACSLLLPRGRWLEDAISVRGKFRPTKAYLVIILLQSRGRWNEAKPKGHS